MSPEIIEYLLRATIIWAVLLVFYGFIRNSTGFGFQRFVLLGGWLFGLIVPLLPSLGNDALPVVQVLPTVSLTKTVTNVVAGPDEAVVTGWSWSSWFPLVYGAGMLLFWARTLVQWKVIGRWFRDGLRTTYDGFRVVTAVGVDSPFAAFGCVFMPSALDDALTHTALLHETSHLRARHHYDKLLLVITGNLLWFHPLFWVYRRLLANVHEYQADAAVLRSVPAKTYGLQLLRSAMTPAYGLGLFSSPLKSRIDMITQKTDRKFRLLPFLALIILLGGLTVACSDLAEDSISPEYETILGEQVPASAAAMYGDAEDMESSMRAFLTDVYQEIRYPAEARTTLTTGKFRAQLVLGTNGEIETLSIFPATEKLAGGSPANEEIVITGYAPADAVAEAKQRPIILTREIDRVLKMFDKWQPALVDGVPVKNVMNIDFNFKLEG